jgi:hypothetical protein
MCKVIVGAPLIVVTVVVVGGVMLQYGGRKY